MNQKKIFLESEGNSYFNRNKEKLSSFINKNEFIISEILELPEIGEKTKILEIGCSDGSRLEWLEKNLKSECYGIEPSSLAVDSACKKGLNVSQGTADLLNFPDDSFDLIIFGFCLYLCDRDDLFKIANETNRVLKSQGWIIILDFYDQSEQSKDYHHREGIKSYKMDYRKLFTWHPNYECMTHKVRHHEDKTYTDNKNEWVATSVLRKF